MATRKIETQIALTGEKEFNDQMKALNNNMKNLGAEMKVVSSAYDENASAADKLKAKQDVLNQQIEQQEEIVRALNEMYEKQKRELGEDAAATDKYRQAMLNAQARLNGFKKELAETDRELEDVARATDKAADESQQAAPKFRLSAEAMEKIAAAGKKAGAALATVAKFGLQTGWNTMTSASRAFAGSLAAMGVASTAAAAGIAILSARGLKQLSAFAIQAAQSGNPAFAGLNKNLEDLAKVSDTAKAALGKVLLPELESFTEKSINLLDAFSREMESAGGDTKLMGDIVARHLRAGAELIRSETPAWVDAAGGLIQGLTGGIIDNETEFKNIASDIVGQISGFLEENADDMGNAAAVLLKTFGSLITDNAPELISAGTAMITSLLDGMDGEKLGTEAANLVIHTLLPALVDVAPDLAEAGLAFVGGIINGVVENWDDIGAEMAELKNGLVETAKSWYQDWHGAGAEWMKGLLAGLQDWWAGIVSWWDGVRNSLAPATLRYTGSMGSTGGNNVTIPREAVGMDVVPSDWYPVYADKDEMILKAPLARELRGLGVTNAAGSIYGALARAMGGVVGAAAPTQVNVAVEFRGSLSQLARVLQPYIVQEGQRRGEALVT